jgi:hypothetical protein
MYVVIAGNPIDGIRIHGMFDDPDSATQWAVKEITEDFWVVEIDPV